MKHLEEADLVLYRYGEPCDRAAIEHHLAECEACQASFAALQRVLAAVEAAPVPERHEAYGSTVWHRIQGRLHPARPDALDWAGWLRPRRWMLGGAMVALLVAAFLAGRYWPSRPAPPIAENPAEVRERVLLVAVGDHLERSQFVLLEFLNAPPQDMVDISAEQKRADDLVAASRLYRQTAAAAGEAGVAAVLEDLERVLLEIARSPSTLSARDWEELRRRIEAQGILFQVRVVGSQVRERASRPAATQAQS